jgi:hypothetical protein
MTCDSKINLFIYEHILINDFRSIVVTYNQTTTVIHSWTYTHSRSYSWIYFRHLEYKCNYTIIIFLLTCINNGWSFMAAALRIFILCWKIIKVIQDICTTVPSSNCQLHTNVTIITWCWTRGSQEPVSFTW